MNRLPMDISFGKMLSFHSPKTILCAPVKCAVSRHEHRTVQENIHCGSRGRQLISCRVGFCVNLFLLLYAHPPTIPVKSRKMPFSFVPYI